MNPIINDEYDNKDSLDIPSYWMITYSDMITIILCFFIVFFVLSANENSLLYEVKKSLTNKIGSLETKNEKLVNENKKLLEDKVELANKLFNLKNIEEDMGEFQEGFIKYLRDHDMLKDVYLVENSEGLLIRFKDSVIFYSGHASITKEGYEILDKISDKLYTVENKIRVEGFTDNIPINTEKYPSNWELSVARSINVVKYFIEKKGIDENRFLVMGWGEHKPIASNDIPEGRAKNRRIEITILN
ncbi:OmpA/MotB family protein [Clostridiisalibacter paucivorans]|uniref:OmpA/MotB family protein n=1 Tax=Clostridiisalibacter paucivorans TaxID=408753 RepID=UPI000688992D|nr:OmpA family protein [Clostridiisalibacter paucivorans]